MNIVYIVIIVVFLGISAFLSASEIVYATVNKIKLEKEASRGLVKPQLAFQITEEADRLITTILVGNNLANNALTSVATVLATSLWGEVNGPWISLIGVTLIVLIVGEIMPKTISSKFSYRCSLAFAKPIRFLELIFKPVVKPINKMIAKMTKRWENKQELPSATDEELMSMVGEIEKEGYIDNETGELIRSAIEFTDVTAHEIMTPRVDVFAFDIEDDLDELVRDENIFTHSRVPVYQDSIDNIIGILNTKTLLNLLLARQKIDLKSILQKPIYVHKTKAISAILREFKETKTHIAIVVDEFGGTMGILTLEDIVEEIVGDIWDEMDVIEEEYTEKAEGEYIVDGDMNIYDLFELVEYDDRDFDSEYTTVGGWCTEVLEHFPKPNDTFDFANLRITILEVDGVRVEKVKVDVIPTVVENEFDE